jgi:predicted alpha/beta hydrolase
MKTTSEPIQITCADGYAIHGTLWGKTSSAKALVLIHPATAVPESLYFAFAEYLVSLGFSAFTYNYRGIGRSRPASLRKFPARMRDWADLDAEAVCAWAYGQFPQLRLLAVGHSFGGHAIGLMDNSKHLHAAVFVASHAGCLRFIVDKIENLKASFLLKVFGPLMCNTLGYVPAHALGLGEDYPPGVIKEWSKWTSLQNYFFDDPTMHAVQRFARPQMPVLAIGFDDDPWATPAGIDLLVSHLTNCRVERRQYSPLVEGSAIGHMGFFRKRYQTALWAPVASWLLSAISTDANAQHA